MTMRDELIRAASAARIATWRADPVREVNGKLYLLLADGATLWNPEHDDGQAQRLAVALYMNVDVQDGQTTVTVARRIGASVPKTLILERHNGDMFAATRRAIFRAAVSAVAPAG